MFQRVPPANGFDEKIIIYSMCFILAGAKLIIIAL
jgi:hypothetical protein